MHTSNPYDSLLIVAFGGPEGPDDVMPFLENVTRGRNIPRERLEEVAEHYYHFGGKSPINDQVRELIGALRVELDARGVALPIYWGNRNWHPMLADTMRQMTEGGHKRTLAIVLAAYSAYSSCRQYRENVEAARQSVGDSAPQIDKVRVFFNHRGFIAANADRLREALAAQPTPHPNPLPQGERGLEQPTPHPNPLPQGERGPEGPTVHPNPLPQGERGLEQPTPHPNPLSPGRLFDPQGERGPAAQSIHVAFTAHSIPASMASNCDYEKQLTETCRLVAEAVGIEPTHWRLVYQSRSGRPQDPWLGPDILEHLDALHARGVSRIVIAPIGFLSDHMEVLYDLDEEAANKALQLGMTMVRAKTVGTHPAFVGMLADLVIERLEGAPDRPAIGRFPAKPDVCPIDCCPAPVSARPAGANSASSLPSANS